MLEVTSLTKTFGDKTAVDSVSFAIERPGVFGLIGTNGAGKTTTIRMILGIMCPDSGSAVWNGAPISRESLSFGYMPEERGIYMKAKVLEQLVYFGQLRGMTKTDAAASANRLMERARCHRVREHGCRQAVKGKSAEGTADRHPHPRPAAHFSRRPFLGA